jgi:predicted transposase/invertase (TIGR01784 family)
MYAILEANLKRVQEARSMEYVATTLDDWLEEIGLMARAEKKGIEKGIEKGLEKTARNALAKGLSVDVISAITGLDTMTITGLSAE